ncbi:MAG: ferrous iron transport protein B [Erysipelotrichaceae bacterium]|nr:ferrous iron transport protein B [Erysipelotrichaceae bacterium]
MKEKIIVLVGQPNTGKSSWMNQLCGSEVLTGNWSGVTVEKSESWIQYQGNTYHFVDLPGIQGFTKQNDEERITESYLMNEKIDCIVQILDSCHIESSLSLTLECRKLQIPMICLLNFKDEAEKFHIHIDEQALSRRLSIPVIWCSSLTNEYNELIMSMIQKQAFNTVLYRPLLNPDSDRIFDDLLKWNDMKQAILIFDELYSEQSNIEKQNVIESCLKYVKGNLSKQNQKIINIDKFLLGNIVGRFVLIFSILIVFYLAILTGAWISNLIHNLFLFFASLVNVNLIRNDLLSSFVNGVVFAGVGSLIGLIPQLFAFHFVFSIYEESGLMSRVSLMMDHIMRCFQLTGKSLISFIIAHGCNVPAIIHTTSLENEGIRKKTALLVPFCSCTARLPVYLYFADTLFQKKGIILCFALYSAGWIIVLMLSIMIEKFGSCKLLEPEIIELVPYRLCSFHLILKKTWNRIKHYLYKIIRVMFLCLSVIWILMNYPQKGMNSIFIQFSKILSILFIPLGFGKYWIYTAALIPGLIAKEASAATLAMLIEISGSNLSTDLSLNFTYLLFIALFIPCLMTLHTIYQKYGIKWMFVSICFSFTVSYCVSWMLRQFIMFF